MDITSVNSSNVIQSTQNEVMKSNIREKLDELKEKMGGENFQFSPMGKMMAKLFEAEKNMSDEGKSEMQEFHHQMQSAIRSGNFDATQMAENAPEELKEYAEANGIDLEEFLEEFASEAQKMMEDQFAANYRPLPPPNSGQNQSWDTLFNGESEN